MQGLNGYEYEKKQLTGFLQTLLNKLKLHYHQDTQIFYQFLILGIVVQGFNPKEIIQFKQLGHPRHSGLEEYFCFVFHQRPQRKHMFQM